MDSQLVKRYRFFREHAGGWVGHSAETALDLARAEALLEDATDLGVAAVQWVDDDTPYDTDLYTDEEIRAKFESNEWTGPYGCIVSVYAESDDASDTLAHLDRVAADERSLWGIVVGQWGTNDPYCRVVAAELASELEDALRQAIGDARDAIDPAGDLASYVESPRFALTWSDVRYRIAQGRPY